MSEQNAAAAKAETVYDDKKLTNILDIAVAETSTSRDEVKDLLDNLIGEDVVSGELGVAPNLGLAADSHTQHRRQRNVEACNPTYLLLAERLVVDMGVTDKDLFFKSHRNSSSHPAVNHSQSNSRVGLSNKRPDVPPG